MSGYVLLEYSPDRITVSFYSPGFSGDSVALIEVALRRFTKPGFTKGLNDYTPIDGAWCFVYRGSQAPL